MIGGVCDRESGIDDNSPGLSHRDILPVFTANVRLGLASNREIPGSEKFQEMKDRSIRDSDWTDLIRRIAAGEQSALGELYDSSSRLMYGLILRITSNPATAEEVLVDAYTQVWLQAQKYDPDRGTPLAWLLTIGRSRALDRLRAGRVEQLRREPIETALQAASSDASPERVAMDDERARMVRAAIAELTPEQREVIDLAFYLGLSHSEIAVHTGLPLGTVKTRIRLGMNKLREQLRALFKD